MKYVLPLFYDTFSRQEFYDRIINFHTKMYELGIGPKTNAIICNDKLELYMNIKLTSDILRNINIFISYK